MDKDYNKTIMYLQMINYYYVLYLGTILAFLLGLVSYLVIDNMLLSGLLTIVLLILNNNVYKNLNEATKEII